MLYLYNLGNNHLYKLVLLCLLAFIFSATATLAQKSQLKEKLKEKGIGQEEIDPMLPSAKKQSSGSVNVPQNAHEGHMTPRNTGSNELSAVNIYQFYEDSEGRMYAVTGEAIDMNDDGAESHWDVGEDLPGSPQQVIEDDQGNIWVATSGGLVHFDADHNIQDTVTTENSGLKMNYINTMALGSNGNLWLGHRKVDYLRDENNRPDSMIYDGGISVYDPSMGEITAVHDTGLAEGPVADLHIRDNGDVWASISPGGINRDEGIYVYRPSADSVWTYRESNSDIPQNQISSIAEDSEGTMWLGLTTEGQSSSYTTVDDTLSGVASFDGSAWTDYSEANTELESNCWALAVDNQDNIYYGSQDTTMMYDGSSWSAFTGGNSRFPLDGMRSMMINSEGNKVFAASSGDDLTGGGIHMQTSDGWQFISSQNDNGLFSNTVFGLTVDTEGRIWASGFYGIAYRENGEWTYFNTHDGLASTYVWKVRAITDGTVWMGNAQNGITRFENGELEVYDEYGPFVETIFEDSEGHIWMGSYSGEQPGVLQYDGDQYTYHDTMANKLGQNVVTIEEGPEGDIYASSEVGIARYDGQEWTKWTPEEHNFAFNEMESDADGNIWIATRDSLVNWDGSGLTTYTPPQGSFLYAPHLEAGPDGSLWINTFYSEMDSVSGERKYITNILDNESWSQVTTNGSPWITAHDSSGSTWIGTNGSGLYKFNRMDAVAIEEGTTRPDQYSLGDNYPNPFNPSTKISFRLPSQSHVKLTVFDMLGREVATLVDESRHAGRHQVSFDASSLASGVYMYRIEAGSFSQTKKMLLVK